MVDGTGLENQRAQAPQVRILSFPPNSMKNARRVFFVEFDGRDENRRFDRATK